MRSIIKPIIKLKLLFICLLLLVQAVHAQVVISTTVIPPVSRNLQQVLSSFGRNIRVTLQNRDPNNRTITVKIFGTLERIAPSHFTITVDESRYNPALSIAVAQFPVPLTSTYLEQAFGNLKEEYLRYSGIAMDDIRDGLNYSLPEGTYQMCLYAKEVNPDGSLGKVVSEPSTVPRCSVFEICYKAAAPQLTQPVNNLNFNTTITTIRPQSPLVFTWTPPRAICGVQISGLTYDLEIREILDNQTINDAVNNPVVFQKRFIPSSAFLMDTNLYKNILQEGNRYIIRIKANKSNPNDNAVIDNNGYSRPEAFQYGIENLAKKNGLLPEALFVGFLERRADFWQNALEAYQKHQRKDTLVPIREYIPLMLTNSGIAYNYDAIELFMALNPDLNEQPSVYLSHVPNMPELPPLSDNDRKAFDSEHALNTQPDVMEEKNFKAYLGSLGELLTARKYPDVSQTMFTGFLSRLNQYSSKVDTVNRVSVRSLNNLLLRFLSDLRSFPANPGNQLLSHLKEVIANADEIMALPGNNVSSRYKNRNEPAGHYQRKSLASFTSFTFTVPADAVADMMLFMQEQPRQFKIIVWHYTREQPNKPVDNAPELKGNYKVYYTSPALYEPKDPAAHATFLTRPASIAQVSLINATFLFWTENLINHKITDPQAVYPMDIYRKSMKGNGPKELAIVLKVD